MLRARYDVVKVTRDVIAIIDRHNGAMSVTNDAENVVAALYQSHRNLVNWDHARIIYLDTEGIWDELRQRNGIFIGFGALRTTKMETAIHLVEGRRE